jgi:glycosyltransferase involved in cell wall biosynthesis
MAKPSISLFFPAYNEEANIRASVLRADEVLRVITDQYEITVVNDGSKDRTGVIADELARNNAHVRVIHHPKNLGYGDGLVSGIRAAKYDWIFFTDADLQFRLEEINKLLAFTPEYRVVIGYRAPRMDSKMRLLNAWGWKILIRILYGLKVRDIDCAFKLFDRKVIVDLPIVTRGATLSAEILIRLKKAGVTWKEVPVSHLARQKGKATGAKVSVIVRAFKELFKLYWSGSI